MSAPAAVAEVGETDATGRFPIRFPALVIEGLDTGDGRYIEPGSLTHRALPLQILAQIQNPVGGDGHDGAFAIGQLENLERVPGPTVVSKETGEPFPEGTFVWVGEGWGTTQTEAGRLAQSGVLRGNSADIVEVRAELAMTDDGDERQAIQSGKIAATTLCPIPAFADSYVIVDEQELALPEALTAGAAPFRSEDLGDELADYQGEDTDPRCAPCELASPSQAKRDKAENDGHAMPGGRYPIETADDLDKAIKAVGRAGGPDGDESDRAAVRRHVITQAKRLGLESKIPDTWKSDGSLKASLVAAAYLMPPTDAFANPGFAELTPIDVTGPVDGWRRISGHIAPFGVCHRGIRGRCETAPHSLTDYSHFKLGAVRTRDADGAVVDVAVGHVTMGIGHYDTYSSDVQAATAHYDNTRAVVADVNAGEDEHGIWISGIVRRHVTDDDVHTLLSAPPSGDWRPVDQAGGNLELVAVLGVNNPGFAVKREAAKVREFTKDGQVTALVASIGPAPKVLPDGSPAGVGTYIDPDRIADGVALRLLGLVSMDDEDDPGGGFMGVGYSFLAAKIRDRLSGEVPLPGTPEAYAAMDDEPEDETADEAAEQAYAEQLRVQVAAAKLRW